MPESSKVSFALGVIVGALFSGLILWAVKWACILAILFLCGCMVYGMLTHDREDA